MEYSTPGILLNSQLGFQQLLLLAWSPWLPFTLLIISCMSGPISALYIGMFLQEISCFHGTWVQGFVLECVVFPRLLCLQDPSSQHLLTQLFTKALNLSRSSSGALVFILGVGSPHPSGIFHGDLTTLVLISHLSLCGFPLQESQRSDGYYFSLF